MPKKIKKRHDHFSVQMSGIKMSEVLMDFAEPLMNEADDFTGSKKALAMAAVFWNLALLPEKEQSDAIKEIFGALPPSAVEAMEETIKVFIHRKKQLFPHVNKFIVDHEVIDHGDTIHVNVKSCDMK